MDVDFDSDDAQIVNKNIFETIYYSSLKKEYGVVKNAKFLACCCCKKNSCLIYTEKFLVTLNGLWVCSKNNYDPDFEYFHCGKADIQEHDTTLSSSKGCIREVFGDTYYKIIEKAY